LLYVVIYTKQKGNKADTSIQKEKEKQLIYGSIEVQPIPNKQSNIGSLSTVNSYLVSLEQSIPVYRVKATGVEFLDREFNTGSKEERLANAKKYFKIVHQNFLTSQLRKGKLTGSIKNTLQLSLYCVITNDSETKELVIKSVNE
jgi:hypothetical protein